MSSVSGGLASGSVTGPELCFFFRFSFFYKILIPFKWIKCIDRKQIRILNASDSLMEAKTVH